MATLLNLKYKSVKIPAMTTESTMGKAKYYEISYIVRPTGGEDNAESIDSSLRGLLAERGAIIESWDSPKPRTLSYEINKSREAVFGALRFNAKSEEIEKIEEQLRERKDLLRFMLLEWKKAPLRTFTRTHKPAEKTETPAESDKAIDEKLDEIFKTEL